MPTTFTLPELQRTFEVVLGRELDKSAFRKRMLDAKVVEEAPGFRPSGKRPAQLYRLGRDPSEAFASTFRRKA